MKSKINILILKIVIKFYNILIKKATKKVKNARKNKTNLTNKSDMKK